MKVIYFGLACAYAVNDDGDFALVGRPTADGWKFEERKELAPEIQKLIAATTGDQDAASVNLPLLKPWSPVTLQPRFSQPEFRFPPRLPPVR